MATETNRARSARRHSLAGAALLCGLGAVCGALMLAILAQPVRSPQPTAHPPAACSAARTQPAWPPAQRLEPAGPPLPCRYAALDAH